MDLAAESLVWYDMEAPQVSLVMTGDGGNSNSAKAIIRTNLMGQHHSFISSEVLQTPDEFRKQGKHFARSRAGTLQENQAGVPWTEDVAKRFLGCEYIACTPLFGKSTKMFRWNKTLKWIEWNRTYPSIRGDWRNIRGLRSFWRRLAAIELGAVFTSDPSLVNINGRVFPEKELTEFLESPEARLIYTKSYLIPFMQKHTADEARDMLKNHSADAVKATQRIVVQMANGGLELPEEWQSPEQRAVVETAAKEMLWKVHMKLDQATIRIYELEERKQSGLPGSIQGKRGGKIKKTEL